MFNRLLLVLLLLFQHQAIAEFSLKGHFQQGGLVFGKTQPGFEVKLNGKPVKVSEQGEFVVGFGRDADLQQVISAFQGNKKRHQTTLYLEKREYPTERITGIEKKYVSPKPEQQARAKKDAVMVTEARNQFSAELSYKQPFIWPVQGRISSHFGFQRIFNGKPARPHYAVDIAVPVGTPVKAPADGVVSMFVPDMFYSGGTLVIDHGYGVSSSFLHLNKSLVKKGQRVKQGEVIAEVGKTGRVTGAHLDWRINWFQERLDPELLVPPMPTQ